MIRDCLTASVLVRLGISGCKIIAEECPQKDDLLALSPAFSCLRMFRSPFVEFSRLLHQYYLVIRLRRREKNVLCSAVKMHNSLSSQAKFVLEALERIHVYDSERCSLLCEKTS